MAKAKRISQGSVENCVVRNCVCLSFLFINNSIHIHCSSSSRPRYRSSWFQQNQEAVNWTSRSPPERAQYRQGSMGNTSYQCSTRGDCSTNWNSCLIDAGKPTGSTFQWCARPFYASFAICSPSQTSLIINQGSFLHTSQGPGVTVRVLWRGQWVRWIGRVGRHVTAISIG